MARPRIVLATFGTLGDLHPFIALAQALRCRGAHPLLATSADYREPVEAAGVDFAPLGPSFADIERDLRLSREQITQRAVARPWFLFDKLVFPYLDRTFDESQRLLADADLLLASSLSFAARIAAERRGIAWLSLLLQPFMRLSPADPPVIDGAQALSAALRRMGPGVTSAVFGALLWMTRPMMAPIDDLRRRAGLPHIRAHPLFDGQFGELDGVGLYSPLIDQAPADPQRPLLQAGFCWFDGASGADGGWPEGLREFLDAGDPPIVFTLGSSIVHAPRHFFPASIQAAHALGRRAVLLNGRDTAPLAVPQHARAQASMFVTGYAPHAPLFARAAAIVHHGGIGTLAQALRSGRPQLIVPFFADQPDNAARASRLGVARTLRPRNYRATSAAGELRRLLHDGAVAARAAAVADMLSGEDGATRAADTILRMLTGLASRRPPTRAGADE
jgi:rhamnosyltransferase subunit B